MSLYWFCIVCETRNTNSIYDTQSKIRCKVCHILKDKYHPHFDHCLIMNERIDLAFPKHQMDFFINPNVSQVIGQPVFYIEQSYHYIINRLKFRSYHSWRKWRRKVRKKKYCIVINKVFDKINKKRTEQLPKHLIIPFL
jgi:hypothetical protein